MWCVHSWAEFYFSKLKKKLICKIRFCKTPFWCQGSQKDALKRTEKNSGDLISVLFNLFTFYLPSEFQLLRATKSQYSFCVCVCVEENPKWGTRKARGLKDTLQNVGREHRTERKSKSTINTNINHILLVFTFSSPLSSPLLFAVHLLNYVVLTFPELYIMLEILSHSQNHVVLKYITLKQTLARHAVLKDIALYLLCCRCIPFAVRMMTSLKLLFFQPFIHAPTTDTILSVVSSGIFGIIGVPSSPLSVCPVQEVDFLCPTAATPSQQTGLWLRFLFKVCLSFFCARWMKQIQEVKKTFVSNNFATTSPIA